MTSACRFPSDCPSYNKWSSTFLSAFTNTSEIQAECKKSCPVECDQVTFQMRKINYKLDMSEEDFDDKFKPLVSARFNISGMSDDKLRSNLAIMNVYYDKLELTEITQIPSMSAIDLMSSVGNFLGLVLF